MAITECITDLHIHSKFSRACSKQLTLPNIATTAALKGIHLMGTGDFTHPEWFKMMKEELEEVQSGFYQVKNHTTHHPVEFVPTVEIACIYKKNDKVRRLHNIVIAPDLKTAAKINKKLDSIGNIKADGRPILGLDSKELLKIVLDASEDCVFIPAHAWTPWFAIFGSKSGFDSIKECFDEMSPHITAIETGLSSDPPMNRQISKLDKITLVSNSDAHSLDNLGREANVFDTKKPMTYKRLQSLLKGEDDGFLHTIEFYPEEGKYHTDGHAACEFRCTPEETVKHGGKCLTCKRPITVGVLSRVNELANRKLSPKQNKVGHKYIVPLREIISEVIGVGKKSKAVDRIYRSIIPSLGTEFEVLIHTSLEDIKTAGYPDVAQAIDKMRRGDIVVEPGYDGIFGTVKIFKDGERRQAEQESLF